MRLVFLTPGTGNWHCGACLRDHALATALQEAGHQVLLAPMYLPLQLDGPGPANSAGVPVFFGGVTIFLRQRFGWFGRAPGWLTRWLDHPALLRLVARRASLTDAASHGEMTLAMLRLEESRMGRDMEQLAAWLAVERPDALCLSNALQAGLIRPLKQRLGVRIVCSFQGEDGFLDGLPEPFRRRCWRELALRVREADVLVAPSRFYADLMRQRLELPPQAIEVVPNGMDPAHFHPPAPAAPPVIGFLARLCREKGVEIMVDAFIHLRQRLGHPTARLHLAGAATAADQPLMVGLQQRLKAAGLASEVTWQPNLTGAEKPAMLAALSLFSVPALCPEAFGLYVVEALAAGVPVVQPAASAFPELLGGAGRLVPPGDPVALAETWHSLLAQRDELRAMSAASLARAKDHFTARLMATRFLALAAAPASIPDPAPDAPHGSVAESEHGLA